MEAQEIFDTVVEHLRRQGCKSETPDLGSCLYRGPEGRKCAVGILIKDEDYTWRMEAIQVPSLLNNFPKLDYLKPHLPLLVRLQDIHDQHPIHLWEDEFRRLAVIQELKYTAPERI